MDRLVRHCEPDGEVCIRSMLELRLLILSVLWERYPSLFEIQDPDAKSSWPQFGRKPLDVVLLLREVCRHGGFDYVKEKKMWQKCGHVLYLPKSCTAMSAGLRNHYFKLLLPLEREMHEWLLLNKKNDDSSKEDNLKNGVDIWFRTNEDECRLRDDLDRFERSEESNNKNKQLKQDEKVALSLSESLNQNKKRPRERPNHLIRNDENYAETECQKID